MHAGKHKRMPGNTNTCRESEKCAPGNTKAQREIGSGLKFLVNFRKVVWKSKRKGKKIAVWFLCL
jgi:hypothetical protein